MTIAGNPTLAPDQILSTFGAEIWRGSSHAWQCDEMGHQNVRFYVAQAMDGIAELLARHGVATRPAASDPLATTTRQYIRLLREIRPGVPLHIRGALTRVSEMDAEVAQLLFHSDTGSLAAAVVSQFAYVNADGASHQWPDDMLRAALSALPDVCHPRTLVADIVPPASVCRERADMLGLRTAAMGVIGEASCDHLGRLRTQSFTSYVSDSTRLITNSFHSAASVCTGMPSNIGSAGVECRMNYFHYPRAGDRFVIRAGLAEVNERIRRTVYWMLDPVSGRGYGTLDSIELLLDLDGRRAFRLPPDAVSAFQSRVINFSKTAQQIPA